MRGWWWIVGKWGDDGCGSEEVGGVMLAEWKCWELCFCHYGIGAVLLSFLE